MKRDTAMRMLENAYRYLFNTGAGNWAASVDAINIIDTAAGNVFYEHYVDDPANPAMPFDSVLFAGKRYELKGV